jgi:hypothetical protein
MSRYVSPRGGFLFLLQRRVDGLAARRLWLRASSVERNDGSGRFNGLLTVEAFSPRPVPLIFDGTTPIAPLKIAFTRCDRLVFVASSR